MASVSDRLLSVYQSVCNARQSLLLINTYSPNPVDTKCQRVHDIVQRVGGITLSLAAEELTELIRDIKEIEWIKETK